MTTLLVCSRVTNDSVCLSQRATAWWWEVAALQQSVQSELPGQADAADYQGPSPGQQHWTWLHSHHKRTPAGQGRRCRYMGACFFAFVHAPWSTVHFVFMLALQIATCFIQQQDRFMLSLFLSLCSLSYTHTLSLFCSWHLNGEAHCQRSHRNNRPTCSSFLNSITFHLAKSDRREGGRKRESEQERDVDPLLLSIVQYKLINNLRKFTPCRTLCNLCPLPKKGKTNREVIFL